LNLLYDRKKGEKTTPCTTNEVGDEHSRLAREHVSLSSHTHCMWIWLLSHVHTFNRIILQNLI